LGMQVLIASRKNTSLSTEALPTPNGTSIPSDVERVPFEDVLRRSTVIILSLPRNPQTIDLFSTPEFAIMSPYAVLVNISRGGIVNEEAVVKAVKAGEIAGFATDVFDVEPAEGAQDSPLLSEEAKNVNITVSPHLAWFSQRTLKNLGQILHDTIAAYGKGEPINVIV
jgi:lactate dehydrogenase-like 2-hydroxyacid dehydrogenase